LKAKLTATKALAAERRLDLHLMQNEAVMPIFWFLVQPLDAHGTHPDIELHEVVDDG